MLEKYPDIILTAKSMDRIVPGKKKKN